MRFVCLPRFPEELTFPNAPVRTATELTFLVRNIGTRASTFTILAEAPFSVSLSSCHLDVGAAVQVTVAFTPQQRGEYEGSIVAQYDTGETAAVRVFGSAVDAALLLERGVVRMPATFIQTVAQKKTKVMSFFVFSLFAVVC